MEEGGREGELCWEPSVLLMQHTACRIIILPRVNVLYYCILGTLHGILHGFREAFSIPTTLTLETTVFSLPSDPTHLSRSHQ